MTLGGGTDLCVCSVEGDQRCPRHCTTAALFSLRWRWKIGVFTASTKIQIDAIIEPGYISLEAIEKPFFVLKDPMAGMRALMSGEKLWVSGKSSKRTSKCTWCSWTGLVSAVGDYFCCGIVLVQLFCEDFELRDSTGKRNLGPTLTSPIARNTLLRFICPAFLCRKFPRTK